MLQFVETVLFFKFPAARAQEYTDLEKFFSQSGNNTELPETYRSCLAKGELLVYKINHDQVSAEQSTPVLVSNAHKSYCTRTHGA